MKELKKLLNSSNTEERRHAVEQLRARKGKQAVALLIDAMKDESWRVRKAATEVLQDEYALEAYVHGVLSLLALEENAGARNSAIDLLVSTGKPAIPYLLEAFRTENRDVRKFVIDIIGEISDTRALSLLLDALKDEDENVKASAVEHLGRLREPSVVNALIDILGSGDVWTAYPAADALGRICDRKAIPALLAALETKTLREPVLRSLACFADPPTLDHILPLLVSGSKSVREEVLRTVSTFYRKGVSEAAIAEKIRAHWGEEAFEILMQNAWSSKPDVRLAAILLLGILKDYRSVRPLLDMSGEEDFREEIKRALVFMGRDAPECILGLFGDATILQRRFLADVAADIRSPAFSDQLRDLLGDEDGHVRAIAARGLAALGDERASVRLLELLTDPFIDVQESAIEALARIRDGFDLAVLVDGLTKGNPVMRKNAALLLGRVGDETVIPAIGFVMKDPEVAVRKAAVQAMARINHRAAMKYLMAALTDEHPSIRIETAYALGNAGTSEGTDALMLLLSDPDEAVRVAAAKAIGIHSNPRATGALVAALSDENGFVVTAAIEALGRMTTEEARSAITWMLRSEDDEIRRTAISSLAGSPGVGRIVEPFLRHADWATRKIAVEVIGAQDDARARSVLESVVDEEDDPVVKKMIEGVLGAPGK